MGKKTKSVIFLISFFFVSVVGIMYDLPTDEIGVIQMIGNDLIENSPPVKDDVWGDMQKDQIGILKIGIGLIVFFSLIFGIIEVIKAFETLCYR